MKLTISRFFVLAMFTGLTNVHADAKTAAVLDAVANVSTEGAKVAGAQTLAEKQKAVLGLLGAVFTSAANLSFDEKRSMQDAHQVIIDFAEQVNAEFVRRPALKSCTEGSSYWERVFSKELKAEREAEMRELLMNQEHTRGFILETLAVYYNLVLERLQIISAYVGQKITAIVQAFSQRPEHIVPALQVAENSDLVTDVEGPLPLVDFDAIESVIGTDVSDLADEELVDGDYTVDSEEAASGDDEATTA